MKYKLIDVKNEIENGVTFGTCELCMSVGTHYYDVLIFEDENGDQHEVEAGMWSWGDYFHIYIENAIEFADWVRNQEIEEELTSSVLQSLVYDFEDYEERLTRRK